MNKNPRYQAWKILVKVFKNHAFSNILLNEMAKQEKDLKNKNLIFNLVHGTITWKIYLDYLAKKVINPTKTPLEIQILLWMSFYQIFFLEKIPNYAIGNEAVQLAKKINPKFGGLINACLKKAFQDPQFKNVDLKDSDQKFCITNAFPDFLYQQLKNQYGQATAEKVVEDSWKKPLLSLRINTLKISHDEFFEKYSTELKLKKSLITKDGAISEIPIFGSLIYQNGLVTIQDQASILVGEVLDPAPDTRVLDMCSAPGGKLTHLAALMNNTGSIVAYEISEKKIPLIESNLKRLGVKNVSLVNGDALTIADEQKFDSILLDAPCSGLGVLKRKPEIKLNYQQENQQKIIQLQAKLLKVAYRNLKVNGFLTYSTCTINRQENDQQILAFVQEYPQMKVIFEKQLFGFEENTDGFYLCKLQKLE